LASAHEYPVSKEEEKDDDFFGYLTDRLKGRDALVMKACRDLHLPASIQAVYEDDNHEVEVLCASVCEPGHYNEEYGPELWEYIKNRARGKVISVQRPATGCDDDEPEVDFPVHWVTEKTVFNEIKSEFAMYGNSPDLLYLYGKMCLIVKVGPPGKRS